MKSASGADVCHSIIDGVLLMKNRELLTMDQACISWEAARLFEREPWLCRW